jgi:nucleoside-diphosphate-sugar epimerase
MRILITGASGFLGGHVVEALDREGNEIVVMARKTSDLSAVEERIDEVRYGDMNDMASLNEATRDIDVVVHCAGAVRMMVPYSHLREINVEGTRRLVSASAESGVGRVIYASSLGVHGLDGTTGRPREKYCRSKAEAEEAFFDECSKGGLEGVALRPGVIYGPRDRTWSFPMFKMVESGNLFLIGNGNTRFPLIYIDDLVEMFVRSIDSKEAVGRSFDLNGEEVTLRRAFENICRCMEKDFEPRMVSYRTAMMAARWGELKAALNGYKKDSSLSRFIVQLYGIDHQIPSKRAREMLGFDPKVGVEEGIETTWQWYRTVQ